MAKTNPLFTDQDKLARSTSERLATALALLAEAHDYAARTSGDPWEFAVEIQVLRELGLSNNDLRYLVGLQYVEHATEVKVAGSHGRRFTHSKDLNVTSRSCFVLSQNGAAAASANAEASTDREAVAATIQFSNVYRSQSEPQLPIWDIARRILAFQDQIVKQFKCQAVNQEVILSAFQEDGWPPRIDDPLAPLPILDEKRRLSDAVKALNRKQRHKLIHFRGDGTGQGVVWERC